MSWLVTGQKFEYKYSGKNTSTQKAWMILWEFELDSSSTWWMNNQQVHPVLMKEGRKCSRSRPQDETGTKADSHVRNVSQTLKPSL